MIPEIQVCKWCGIIFKKEDTQVGFGNGTGVDFAHRVCYDEFKTLFNSVTEYDNGAIEIFDRLVERVKENYRYIETHINIK